MPVKQSRKWHIEINNPVDKGYTHEKIKEILKEYKSLVYYCMSDEIGNETQKYHSHIFVNCKNGILFETILKDFKGGHIEACKGTSKENRDYIFKEGKWLTDKKADTNLRETHEEWGELPVERQGQRNDLIDLYDAIKQGKTNYEIIEENPEVMFSIEKIERVRQMLLEEKYKNVWRDLYVEYDTGEPGTGKSRNIADKYGMDKVYRITDTIHPWDGYKGQDVIVFEDFRSSCYRISDMLNYLDGYPLELPCRYANKIACYTKVYITSNLDLTEQYEEIQEKYPSTWKALLRRIKKIHLYHTAEDIEKYDMKEMSSLGIIPCINEKENIMSNVVKFEKNNTNEKYVQASK